MLTTSLILALTLVPTQAASFDGTYNYAYNLNGPNGWETHRVDSGFIVRNGQISSNPPALSGTVDSSGNVRFTGPSPYGGGSATFTGVIHSDGTGEGNYRDSQGLGGKWSVARVSGSGGSGIMGIVDTMLSLMYSLSFIGEAIGFSGTTAAAIGTAAVIFAFVMVVSIVSTAGSQRRGRTRVQPKFFIDRQGEYAASQPEAPIRTHETPASAIGVPPPPRSPSVGLDVVPPGLPDRLVVQSAWGNRRVDLTWDSPQYDPEKYELMGYEIVQMLYDGTSTAPSRMVVDQLPPGNSGWTGPFDQTYRWNTAGDIEGYQVDALFQELNVIDSSRIVRVSSTAYAPNI